MKGSFLFVCILFLFFLCNVEAGQAQPAPSGSYSYTCRDAHVDRRGFLIAKCQDERGDEHGAILANVGQCWGNIFNKDGTLDCIRRETRIPLGSYYDTCLGIDYENGIDTLYATCRNEVGGRVFSILKNVSLCKSQIQNIRGNLACKMNADGVPSEAIPGGSYQETCFNISVRNGVLNATCLGTDGIARNGGYFDIGKCPSRSFSNWGGTLQCLGLPPANSRYSPYAVPSAPGSYPPTRRY